MSSIFSKIKRSNITAVLSGLLLGLVSVIVLAKMASVYLEVNQLLTVSML